MRDVGGDPKVPPTLLDQPEFIAACSFRDMAAVFRLAQKHGGLSGTAIGRQTDLTPARVREVIAGRRRLTGFDVIERVADGLGIPGAMLGLSQRPWEQVAQWSSSPDTMGASNSGIMIPGEATNLVDMQRLEALRLALQGTLSEGAMATTSLDDWERTVIRYGASTRDKAPSLLIYDLANDLGELNRSLATTRTASSLQRLTRVAAQMTGLMVLSLVKLDDRTAFRRWSRTARLAAAEAGDPVTHAWVLVQEAYGHYYCDDFAEAIHVAQHTQTLTTVPCVGTALAAALEARAHAAIGNHAETVRALDRAESILSNLSSEATISSAFGYSESQLRFHAGSAFTHLHDIANAAREHDRALELIPPADYTDLAFVHIDRATCLAQEGDAAGAANYLTQTLTPLSNDQRRGIIATRARDVIRELPPGEQSRPEVTDLIDLLSADNPETGV